MRATEPEDGAVEIEIAIGIAIGTDRTLLWATKIGTTSYLTERRDFDPDFDSDLDEEGKGRQSRVADIA